MTDSTGEVPFSPTEPYRFCPADGTRLMEPRPSGGTTCPMCGRSWYRNSSPAVGAAIVRDGKALVSVRAREPEKGRVDVPGGFLEVGEHATDGIVREVKEELGVDVDIIGGPFLLDMHTYGADGGYVLPIGFRVRIIAGEPKPSDDVAELRWISAEEIDDTDFAWEHDRGFVRAALEDA